MFDMVESVKRAKQGNWGKLGGNWGQPLIIVDSRKTEMY